MWLLADLGLMDALTALTEAGGLGTTQELLRMIDRRELDRAVGAGEIVRGVRGQYELPGADAASAAARRAGGTVSHLSAALHWGWKVRTAPKLPQIVVPRGRTLTTERRADAEIRWVAAGRGDEVPGVTTRVRTVLDCARDLPFDEALCVADSALRDGRVTQPELLAAGEKLPRTGRAKAVRVLEAASPLAANPFESVLRAIAIGVAGLDVKPQVAIGHLDRIGAADLVDVRLQIVAEAESWEFHGHRDAFNYDLRRYTEMVRGGWRVVRFSYDDVMHRSDYVHDAFADLVKLKSR